MLIKYFTKEHINAIEELITLIYPIQEDANRYIQKMRELDDSAIEEMELTYLDIEYLEPDELDDIPTSELLWIAQDVCSAIFRVDWKNRESFVTNVVFDAEAWGGTLTFGVNNVFDEDFQDTHSVGKLMQIAHQELAEQGLILWNWNTQEDCYSGWISRYNAISKINSISNILGVEIRQGDQPF